MKEIIKAHCLECGVVIEHRFIETIRTAIEDDGLKKHFTLDDVGR